DLLIGKGGITNSHMFGGQGDDTLGFSGTGVGLVASGHTTNDVETGGLGNNLFLAANDSGSPVLGAPGNDLLAADIVTVTDFLSGTDKLAETSKSGVGLLKIDGSGDSAAQALAAANNFYASNPGSEYVFVYGGTGAGYLFYNGDNNATRNATAGM